MRLRENVAVDSVEETWRSSCGQRNCGRREAQLSRDTSVKIISRLLLLRNKNVVEKSSDIG